MRRTLVFVPLLIALAAPAQAQKNTAASNQAPLDLTSYLAQIDSWSAAIARVKEHPEEASALRNGLPKAWSVSIGCQHFEVSTQWFDSELASVEKDPRVAPEASGRMRVRLAAMRASAQALEQPRQLDPKLARTKLDEILRRQEFRSVHGPTWWDRLRDRLVAWLADFIETVLERLHGHPTVARIFLWGLVIGIVLAFLVWMVRLVLSQPVGIPLGLEEAAPASQTWQRLARAAVEAGGQGAYRDAIRLAYWAGIYRLEELGLWRADRTRTHREYLRLLPATHPQRGAFSAVTSCFERAWYGAEVASPEEFQFALVQLEKLGCGFPSTPATASS